MPAPEPTDEADRLTLLRLARILDTPAEEDYDRATELASWIAGTPIALVSLVDADRQWFKARVGLDATETPRDMAFCAHAILQPDDVFVVEDTTTDRRFATNPLVVDDPAIRFYAGAPIMVGETSPIGTLCVIDRRPRRLDHDQLEALQTLARMVAGHVELRLVNANLEAAREAAESASRAKSTFLATMSHEFRTPLNAIIGLSGLLLRQDLPPRQEEYAAVIRRSGEHLLEVVGDVLDLSRLEAGHVEIDPTPVDLVDVAGGVVAMLAPAASERGIDLELTVGGEPVESDHGARHVALSDERLLRQVLTNLIGNAVKFTVQGRVVVDIEPVADGIRVEVVDTGPGIAADAQVDVFSPFVQADGSSTRRHEGTGLGLAIAAQLVEVLGGEIGLDSEVGRGSTFWFTVIDQ